MIFKSLLDIDCGIRFMYDRLPLSSSSAKTMLLESRAMTSKREIDLRYGKLNSLYNKECREIASKLTCLKDISNTIGRLGAGAVLDDIELFEIKYLATVSRDVAELMQKKRISVVNLPDLGDVMKILDPDSLNIPSFYIYDSYSSELAAVRKRMKALTGLGDRIPDENQARELAGLQQKNDELEEGERRELSLKLSDKAGKLGHTLKNLSLLDIMIASVAQMKEMGLCFPAVVENGETFYKGMFNPAVKEAVEQKGGRYVQVDISFSRLPVTVVGANMGGKSVVLKSLALNQILAQFGLGIAAQTCCVSIVDKILFCIGDDQNAEKGISSFAAEMLAVNEVVEGVSRGENMLALLDEPARATNPIEGTALVEGLLDVLQHAAGSTILATHYNIVNRNVKRYRVAGLKEGKMDYSLIETESGDVPHEAIAIAQQLGVNKEWIESTKKYLN